MGQEGAEIGGGGGVEGRNGSPDEESAREEAQGINKSYQA